jgi:YidC/Oxa1 family membrane protein insertase
MKKILKWSCLVLFVVMTVGCTVPRDADNNVILITNETTFSSIMADENWFSAIFVYPLSKLINLLAPKISVGGAIIAITVLVNGIVACVTYKSTIATQQMQLIQPELEKIQRKYEGRDDDTSKMRQAAEMQALYKKYNISPTGTLLVTFIQFPILMAMYMAVQRSEAVQTGTFLGMKMDSTPLSGIQGALKGDVTGWVYLGLFIFMAICQFVSMKLPQIIQKKKAEAEAAKHHRKPEVSDNKSMKFMQIYMMAMILMFGLMWPSAMALYWAINSLVNIVKTLVIQKVIDKQNQNKKGAR